MIFNTVPSNLEIVPPGCAPRQSQREPRHTAWYSEFMGGLGDALLRVYRHQDCYQTINALRPNERGVAVLMCHNPSLAELFAYHPANLDGRLDVFDLGFRGPSHPWENPLFRLTNGMPEHSPCPRKPDPDTTLEIYPHPSDSDSLAVLASLGRYVILNMSAGTKERDIPQRISDDIVRELTARQIAVAVVGHPKYQRCEVPRGATSLIGQLSLPGTIIAERMAVGVVTPHTSTLHIAWGERRPVFLVYPQWVFDVWQRTKRAEGYFFGANQPKTDHMPLWDYSVDRFVRWVETL